MRDTQSRASRAVLFSVLSLILRNLKYYWRSNFAVVLGTAVSVAALTGSLIVGDSARGTLHDLAVERLGSVKVAISTPHFFREELADNLLAEVGGSQDGINAMPALMANAAAQSLKTGASLPSVHVLGVTDEFLDLSPGGLSEMPEGRKIALNSQLAQDLGLSVGDSVLVTLGRKAKAPTSSIFARRERDAALATMRLMVEKIVPSNGIGLFSLTTGRGTPRNIYISLNALQQRLGVQGKANTILVACSEDTQPDSRTIREGLLNSLHLPDYGLRIAPSASREYFSLESDRLVLPTPVVEQALGSADKLGMKAEASSIYMANAIIRKTADGSRQEIPYSVIASIPRIDVAPFGPLPAEAGDCSGDFPWQEGGLLNAWAAEDLGASVGHEIELEYYAADESNVLQTRSVTVSLKGIVAMEGPGADPDVAPSFKGITDAESIEDWDPPFPIDLSRIRAEDDAYWNEYRTTPKVYLHSGLLQYLWDSDKAPTQAAKDDLTPLDWTTSVRIAPPGDVDLAVTIERFSRAFLKESDPERFGVKIESVAERALNSAKGSSDFGILFLSMSFFIVAAAAGLVGMFFRLAVEQRASQHGIMMATGIKARQIRQVLMGEGALLAATGVMLGAPLGVGYAALITLGLRTVWHDATGGLAFTLHVTAVSLLLGSFIGFVVALAALRWALRALGRRALIGKLSGWSALLASPRVRTRTRSIHVMVISTATAGALLLMGFLRLLPLQVTFFLSGALAMIALLSVFYGLLQRSEQGKRGRISSLWRFGLRGASRNLMRSIVTSGSMACACFILVTVAANQRDLTRVDVYRKNSGSGGFSLVAHATTPVYKDLNLEESWAGFALPTETLRLIGETTFSGFPVSDGDDISCLNVQKPQRPTVLGVPKEIIERNGFRFAKTLRATDSSKDTHGWQLLAHELSSGGRHVIPAITDAASAEWVLHVGLGEEIEIADQQGNPVYLRLVGLLSNSIFQSEILISEENFRRYFDDDAGDRYYLIDTQPGKSEQAAKVLRQVLGEHGFDVKRTADLLASYAKVQNAYLRTFQTLGGIGLLLGTFGIVAVLLRSVVERRAEFAMLLALGFRRKRIIHFMLAENGLLLVIGTLVGSSAALLAVSPHSISAVADVNWLSLSTTLLACLASGLLSCYVAAAFSVRKDLISALRSE